MERIPIMGKIFLRVIAAFFLASAGDTIKVIVSKAPIVKLPTEVKPKAPTNWSRVKDLFL